MPAVCVNVNAVDVLGVNVACDVIAFVDDEDRFPALVKIVRDDCASESCSYNETIIHEILRSFFGLRFDFMF